MAPGAVHRALLRWCYAFGVAKRIRRQRTKGWRLPDGAIYVGRPTVYGNPYRADQRPPKFPDGRRWGRREAVNSYSLMLGSGWRLKRPPGFVIVERAMAELEGLDLACWCPLNEPCHADVLLWYANEPGFIEQELGAWTPLSAALTP